MNEILIAVFILWAGYAVLLVVLMAVVKPKHPAFTGFRIHMPRHVRIILPHDEYVAIYAHECGHQALKHVWKNYLRAIFFIPTPLSTRQQQEIEADDWATTIVHPEDLANGLVKLGAVTEFEQFRIARLRKASGMLATQSSGMDEQSKEK